jgi:hypothetical protein
MTDTIESLRIRILELEDENEDLKRMLGQKDRRYDVAFNLPRAQARLLGLFMTVPVVTKEMVEERLGIATNARVAIHRLRQSLYSHEVFIKAQVGVGYWLTPEMKARVKAKVEAVGVIPPELSASAEKSLVSA